MYWKGTSKTKAQTSLSILNIFNKEVKYTGNCLLMSLISSKQNYHLAGEHLNSQPYMIFTACVQCLLTGPFQLF